MGARAHIVPKKDPGAGSAHGAKGVYGFRYGINNNPSMAVQAQ
jgi:hypothetical protein